MYGSHGPGGTEIDERFFDLLVEFGIREIEGFLSDHAQYAKKCAKREVAPYGDIVYAELAKKTRGRKAA